MSAKGQGLVYVPALLSRWRRKRTDALRWRRISECVFQASCLLKGLESDLENISRVSFEHKEEIGLGSTNMVPLQAYRNGEMSSTC